VGWARMGIGLVMGAWGHRFQEFQVFKAIIVVDKTLLLGGCRIKAPKIQVEWILALGMGQVVKALTKNLDRLKLKHKAMSH
jgi:hypothetical protein